MLVAIILVGLLGIAAGAVINLLADELPERRPLRPPRYPDGAPRPSIAWSGITAFLLGKRTSPNGFSLPWRHPLTEIATAALMIVTLLVVQDDPQMTPLQFAYWLAYMAIFVLITVIDLEHRLILFVVIIPSYILALIDAATTSYGADIGAALLGAGLGFGVFFLLYVGGFIFTYVIGQIQGTEIKEVAFGYGDVMLITLAGLILGWQPLIVAMFITVFLGAFGAILYLIIRNLAGSKYNLFTPLPYGQYIIVGAVIMLLFAPEVTNFLRGPP
jgi:prepilin signal peptidase PulO-like enzyme (type II secretory pathway)